MKRFVLRRRKDMQDASGTLRIRILNSPDGDGESRFINPWGQAVVVTSTAPNVVRSKVLPENLRNMK